MFTEVTKTIKDIKPLDNAIEKVFAYERTKIDEGISHLVEKNNQLTHNDSFAIAYQGKILSIRLADPKDRNKYGTPYPAYAHVDLWDKVEEFFNWQSEWELAYQTVVFIYSRFFEMLSNAQFNSLIPKEIRWTEPEKIGPLLPTMQAEMDKANKIVYYYLGRKFLL